MSDRTMKCLVIVSSHHHGNTGKIARAMADVLGSAVVKPRDVDREGFQEYDLVGFGSGIDSDRHYKALLDCADALPSTGNKKAFIFSTCGMPVTIAGEGGVEKYARKCHAALREKLVSKGCTILGEFICPGFNTNSFLRFFGGLNKGRPNETDTGRAEAFARRLKAEIESARERNGG